MYFRSALCTSGPAKPFARPLSRSARTCTPADEGGPPLESPWDAAGPQASPDWDVPRPTPRDLAASATFDGVVRCVADSLLCPRYNIVFVLGNGGLFLKTF